MIGIGIPNDINQRIGIKQQKYRVTLMTNNATTRGITCVLHVVEQLHCVHGPAFAEICPPIPSL
jgi:type IV secretory pathway VirB3-like protein